MSVPMFTNPLQVDTRAENVSKFAAQGNCFFPLKNSCALLSSPDRPVACGMDARITEVTFYALLMTSVDHHLGALPLQTGGCKDGARFTPTFFPI